MKNYLLFLFSFFLFSQCQSSSESKWDTQIFEALQKLEADQMTVNIKIDEEAFYPTQVPFNGTITLNEPSCFINLRNLDGGNIVISLEENDWYKAGDKTVYFKEGLTEVESMHGSFLIGRKDELKGEGYIINDGSFQLKQLNNEACIVTIKGNVKSPFDQSIIKPIEGFIVWKKPATLNSQERVKTFFFN
ncbi:hypothetical protein [uncultured Arcticibacterium sp.]|uniref:hypothetical protein n=1 Tax=uncultured Arcticibacterium sp. TaxID=2173042 RepID=UPI0030F50B19